MDEKFTVRRFVPADAVDVQRIIHRGLREINGKDYPAERIEEYCVFLPRKKSSNRLKRRICMWLFQIRAEYWEPARSHHSGEARRKAFC